MKVMTNLRGRDPSGPVEYMETNMTNLHHEIVYILPEIILSLWGLMALMLGVFEPRRERVSIHNISFAGLLLTGIILFATRDSGHNLIFNNLMVINDYTQTIKIFIVALMSMLLIMMTSHLERAHMNRFEVSILLIFATVGMMLMVSAHDFMTVFMGIELQSLCLYILVALARGQTRGAEAGVKYFSLGALSTCFLLFGISYVYGYCGTTEFQGIKLALDQSGENMMILHFALSAILVSLCFKISIAPFHMWTPDVYEGSPLPIAAVLATAPKVAGVCLLFNILVQVF